MQHTTFPWQDARDNLSRPIESPINKLIDHVLDSELPKYLHVATMHYNLRIGRSKNFSRNDGELTIEYREFNDAVIFNYFDSEQSEPWVKICRSEEIITTFNYIIFKKLRWFKRR